MARHQRGWLKVEQRKDGPTWVLRYHVTRPEDGKRVEHKTRLGLVSEIGKSKSAAWAAVERLHLNLVINQPGAVTVITVADVAGHYVQTELPKRAHTTQYLHKHIINDYLVPRWGSQSCQEVRTVEIQQWIDTLQTSLATPTRAKIRDVMHRIYQHGVVYLLPDGARNPVANVRCVRPRGEPKPKPTLVPPALAFKMVSAFPILERTLTLLTAATGLRISECLGLQWQDVDWQNHCIHVRRKWTHGNVDEPKTEASAAPVPMSKALELILRDWKRETAYSRSTDWLFPSYRLKGAKPRTGSVMARSYLRKAAVALGILKKGDRSRFGFHSLRHSLASFLVTQAKEDPKTVQGILRHAHVRTTLDIYTHANLEAGLVAQEKVTREWLQ